MVAINAHSKKPLQPHELGELYPTAKTYDDIQDDTEARQEYFDTLRTRIPAFKIAFFSSLLIAAIIYYATNSEVLWLLRDAGVSAVSYAVWAALALFAIKWLRYTANIFYEYSSNSLVFWCIYIVAIAAAVAAWKFGPWLAQSDPRWLPILPAINFVVTYISAKLLIKK